MRWFQTILLCSLTVLPAIAQADGPISDDEINSILQSKALEINTIGMLKFCGKSGIEKTILVKTTGSILSRFVEENRKYATDDLERVVNAIDIQSIGVATGLSLFARTAPDRKAQFCDLAVGLADKVLSDYEEEKKP